MLIYWRVPYVSLSKLLNYYDLATCTGGYVLNLVNVRITVPKLVSLKMLWHPLKSSRSSFPCFPQNSHLRDMFHCFKYVFDYPKTTPSQLGESLSISQMYGELSMVACRMVCFWGYSYSVCTCSMVDLKWGKTQGYVGRFSKDWRFNANVPSRQKITGWWFQMLWYVYLLVNVYMTIENHHAIKR